ncbi:hypothetical protein [Prosthecobacter sp.]|jgi:hypothetical protein|uniref:hypothetical protein n=1 Tax=Prosthecobacter sp. TaxID=1965333 RepID=UPI00378379BA
MKWLSLIFALFPAACFSADASMAVKNKAGKEQWWLELWKNGTHYNSPIIKVSLPPDPTDPSGVRIPILYEVPIRSDSYKSTIITALTRLEEMARNAKIQKLTSPITKRVEAKKLSESFVFRINENGSHLMTVNDNVVSSEMIAALKLLISSIDRYAAELEKMSKI